MSLSASVGVQIPTNVVEVGNEISQNSINALAAASSPSTVNPLMTSSAVAALYATKASPTFTGTVTIPAGASIAGYATQSYVTGLGYLTDAPSNGSEYVRKNGSWAVATGGGGGGSVAWGSITGTLSSQTDLTSYVTGLGYQTASDVSTYVGGLGHLTVSTLSNAATSTLNSTAPTAGQALTFDGTDLKWATVGGGGGASWGSITGSISSQTDLVSYIGSQGFITAVPTKSVNTYTSGGTLALGDCNNIIYLASGGMGFNITADNDVNVAYPNGFEATVVVDNTSTFYSIQGGMGVSINGTGAVTIVNYVSKLVKVSANTWYFY